MQDDMLDTLPIFRQYAPKVLAAKLGYRTRYIYHLRTGYHPITPRFVFLASKLLKRPAEELFGPSIAAACKRPAVSA